MSYMFFKVTRDKDTNEIVSELFELDSQEGLPEWESNHLEWHDSKKDLLDSEKDVATFVPAVKEKKLGEGELKLTADQLKIIIRLLKGEQINNRQGLSLTSFANLFGVSYNQRGRQSAHAKLKPQYELLLKQLRDKDEVKQVRKCWYYKNAIVRGRKIDPLIAKKRKKTKCQRSRSQK